MGIEDIFLAALADLPFKDKLIGETYPLKRKIKDKVQVFPVAINTPTTCDNSVYTDLVPNSKKKSIIYFEKTNFTVNDVDSRYMHVSENWRLVCWLHMKIINKNYKDIYPFFHTVIRRIPEAYGNYGYWIDVYIKFKGTVASENVFSKYTYSEDQKQYMIYPFGFFAVDYEVSYRIAKECLTDITLDPDLC